MKVKRESEVAQLCPTPSDPMDCSPPGSSVHEILQARVLEWAAIAFSIAVLSTFILLVSYQYHLSSEHCSFCQIETVTTEQLVSLSPQHMVAKILLSV